MTTEIKDGKSQSTTLRAEQMHLEREVRKALHVLGTRRVAELCYEHVDARYMEADDHESKGRWLWVRRRFEGVLNVMKPKV